jgi:hypothetical protein
MVARTPIAVAALVRDDPALSSIVSAVELAE